LLDSNAYQEILSPEIFDINYIDSVVKRYLKNIEFSGSELSDLSALVRLMMVLQ